MVPSILMKTLLSPWVLYTVVAASGCFFHQRPRQVVPRFAERTCTTVAKNSGDHRTMYAVDLGSRVGVVVRSEDVVELLGWSIEEVFNHPWIEVSWGSPTLLGVLVEAPESDGIARRQTIESVFSVTPIEGSPEKVYVEADLVRLRVTSGSVGRVAELIDASLAKSDVGASQKAGFSLQGRGTLYFAVGRPTSSQTNATWAAQAIAAAGCPIQSVKPNGSNFIAALYSIISPLEPIQANNWQAATWQSAN